MKQIEPDTLKTRLTLLSKVRRGDEAGWRRFYELYENFVYSAARSTGLAHDDANDVVQDTMITVQNYITSFVPDENPPCAKSNCYPREGFVVPKGVLPDG